MVASRLGRLAAVLGTATALLSALVAAGCATAPAPAIPAPPFHDEAFAAPATLADAAEVFALSDDMRRVAGQAGGALLREGDLRHALLDTLYKRNKLVLDYDASVTRTAAEAWQARAGNCLSLVIMTSAFAKALGVPVTYRRVLTEESWSRSADLYFAAGHVNLMLGWSPMLGRGGGVADPGLIVDFLPGAQIQGQRAETIGEATVLAMFMNNRAAEAMTRGDLDAAYWYARESVRQDPRFLIGHNTLGVVYLRRGMVDAAAEVFAQVLRHEPDNTKVMGNNVIALRRLGRAAEADAMAAALQKIEPVPPFHWFNAGIEAMRERDYARARDFFQREIRREAYYHEFHFWLGLAELGLGNVGAARQQVQFALANSTTQQTSEI